MYHTNRLERACVGTVLRTQEPGVSVSSPSESPHAGATKLRARQQFDQWARSYDRSLLNEFVFYPSIRACQEEVERWKRDNPGRCYRLLDVGCGTGNLLGRLRNDPAAEMLVGLDYSAAMTRALAEKIAASSAAGRTFAVQGDSEHLPFADAAFDVVTCCNSFHHYPRQANVIREFRRVLRPGGRLFLIDGFRDNVVGWFIFDVCVSLAEGGVHHAAWSAVRRMVLDAGFGRVAQRKMNVLAPLLVTVAHA